VNAKDDHGMMPLHLAAVSGQHCVFSALADAGASNNMEARFDWNAIDQASIAHHGLPPMKNQSRLLA
jgi:ankyrin repeat protein